MKDFSNIDFNALKRYTSSQGIKDFDRFLDGLPMNVGHNALIAAGIAWLIAGCSVFFTALEADNVSTLRAELMKVEAIKPPIPIITYSAVPKGTMEKLQKTITDTFPVVSFAGTSTIIKVSVSKLDYFPQFLAAINMLQNGAKNWRVSIDEMCIGMDCKSSKVSASLKIESVRVDSPKKDVEE